MKQVKNLAQLKRLAARQAGFDGFIALNYGLKSSKFMTFGDGKFFITNLIDGSDQELTEQELFEESNIGNALKAGALWEY